MEGKHMPIIAFIVATIWFASAANADSDGTYCIGKNYIAYESWFSKPNHTLTLLQPIKGKEIVKSTDIRIEEEQIHGMECKDGLVEIYYYDRVCRTNVDSIKSECSKLSEKKFPKSDSFSYLGFVRNDNLVQFKIIPLPDWPGDYELHLIGYEHRKGHEHGASIQHYGIARIVKSKELYSQIEGMYEIFNDHFYESID